MRMIPPVTKTMLIANVGVFAVVYLLFGATQEIFNFFGLMPGLFKKGAFWQPLTSMFMHGGFAHLAFNMIALWSIGTPIEKDIGARRFAILYFISGMCGALLVILFQGDQSLTVGASGAVVGLLGALAVFYPDARLLVFFFPMKARTAALLFGAVSLFFSFYGQEMGISHLGHLGGLLGGLAYSKFAIGRRTRGAPRPGDSGFAANGESTAEREMRNVEVMREMLRNMNRSSGRSVFMGGQFIDTTDGMQPREREINPEANPDNKSDSAPKDEKRVDGAPKRLYYDSVNRRFFFD